MRGLLVLLLLSHSTLVYSYTKKTACDGKPEGAACVFTYGGGHAQVATHHTSTGACVDGYCDKEAIPIESAETELGRYPAYPWMGVNVSGSIEVANLGEGKFGAVEIRYELRGLAPNLTAGLHIHQGKTCKTTAEVAGHLYPSHSQADPWTNITYTSDATGFAKGAFEMQGFELIGLVGHAVVVHGDALDDGVRVACGVLKPPVAPSHSLWNSPWHVLVVFAVLVGAYFINLALTTLKSLTQAK